RRRRRPQLRRFYDRQPAGPLRPVQSRRRAQRRVQPHAHPVRIPERAPHVLGSARDVFQSLAVHACEQCQRADPADPRRGRQQLRHASDPERPHVPGAKRQRRQRSLRDAAIGGAWIRRPRIDRTHSVGDDHVDGQIREGDATDGSALVLMNHPSNYLYAICHIRGLHLNTWTQNYDPLGSWRLSTLVAAAPVLTLFFVLVALKKRVWFSAMCGMLMAVFLALVVFRMPAAMVGASAAHGVIFGILRIAWIIIASMFLYNVAVETGQFQVMKDSIASLSSDKRLQLILIAFCFGAFLEGASGGGAPVAIAGSFLIGLGFPSFQAATLCLIANTAPVAWGGVGNPLRVLA